MAAGPGLGSRPPCPQRVDAEQGGAQAEDGKAGRLPAVSWEAALGRHTLRPLAGRRDGGGLRGVGPELESGPGAPRRSASVLCVPRKRAQREQMSPAGASAPGGPLGRGSVLVFLVHGHTRGRVRLHWVFRWQQTQLCLPGMPSRNQAPRRVRWASRPRPRPAALPRGLDLPLQL